MPASDISRLSIVGQPKSNMASNMARDAANREMSLRIKNGHLSRADDAAIRREWKDIYRQEYYKHYAILMINDQSERIIYVPSENPSAKKFYVKHAVAGFNRTNCFIHVHKDSITVGKFNFPIDGEISLETKEAFLETWPGPLDRHDGQLQKKTTDYIRTLWQHDSQRKIRYCSNDEQRKTILKLLKDLLQRNGSFDAPGITGILLNPEQTEIQKDDDSKNPLETLQKYLLVGDRSTAIKHAKSRKLWDHAQCLAFLDKYQPQMTNNYIKDNLRLKDDSIVQLNYEYISSVDHGILSTVYRSLLNRILQSDPESLKILNQPKPNVGNDAYQFAILSANDCEMDFDHTNEIFKLVTAMKNAKIYRGINNDHLISLGFTTLDTDNTFEDMSYRSHISCRQNDTYAARTLIISNIDQLILNEIWEYCLNLVLETNDPTNYNYILDLVPYKLVFAARLLDLGLYEMFAYYLISIKNAVKKACQKPCFGGDQFYDWNAINLSVQYLTDIWEIFRKSSHITLFPEMSTSQTTADLASNLSPPSEPITFNAPPPTFNSFPPQKSSPRYQQFGHEQRNDPQELPQNYNSLSNQGEVDPVINHNFAAPHMGRTLFTVSNANPSNFSNPPPPIPEEVTDFNPEPDPSEPKSNLEARDFYEEQQSQQLQPPQQQSYHQQQRPFLHNQQSYNDNSSETSRRPSLDMPPYSPPTYGQSNMSNSERNMKSMNSSSPVNNKRESVQSNQTIADSFNAFSPINEYGDNSRSAAAVSSPPLTDVDNSGNVSNNRTNDMKSNDPQQAGLFANIAGSVRSLLPKSNSKQMILPDDSSKSIVYDKERGTWVDTTKPEGDDPMDFSKPPPVQAVKPASYSFAPKSTKTRYPKAPF